MAYQNVVAEIESLPDGPEIGALFDFDGTIISGYSAIAFFQEQVKRGHMSPRDVVELISVMASFGIGILGFPALMLAPVNFEALYQQAVQQAGPAGAPQVGPAEPDPAQYSWRGYRAYRRRLAMGYRDTRAGIHAV